MPTTTSTNPLWDLQAQYLPGTFQAATDLYNQGAPSPYQGQRVANFDPVRAQGLNLGVDAALGAQSDLAQAQTGLLGGILGGTDAGTQQLANQAAQASQGVYGAGGTLGSARGQQAAANAASQAILDRQLQASGQVAQAQQNAARPGSTLASIGQQTQDYGQSVIDANIGAYNETANLPAAHLQQYQNFLAPAGISAPTTGAGQKTGFESGIENAAGLIGVGTSLFGDGGLLSGFFAEGGEVGGQTYSHQAPNKTWQMVDGRLQLADNPDGGLSTRSVPTTGYVPPQIGYDASGNTQVGGSGSHGGAAIAAGASGSGGSGDYTTYGGSRDNAHSSIDEAFTEYGKAITAGTARPEDNPAYNAESAAVNSERPITYTTNSGESVTKKAGELTSEDFANASLEDQYALSYASMAAAGIKNLGGGYNQPDPTTGATGAISDGLNYALDWAADTLPDWSRPGLIANLFDSPNSTYDPVGVSAPAASNRDDGPSAAQIAADNARSTASNVTSSNRTGGAALDSAFGISGLAMGGEVMPEWIAMKKEMGLM